MGLVLCPPPFVVDETTGIAASTEAAVIGKTLSGILLQGGRRSARSDDAAGIRQAAIRAYREIGLASRWGRKALRVTER